MHFIDMTNHEVLILILTFEEFFTYLLIDLQSSFRHNLPRLETHNELLDKDRTSACFSGFGIYFSDASSSTEIAR